MGNNNNVTFKIGNLEIPCTVKRSRVKHVYIRMKIGGLRLEVTVPLRSSPDIQALLRSSESWITKKYRELALVKNTMEKDKILVKGEEHRLEIRSGRSPHISFSDHAITIEARNEAEAWRELMRWMKLESMKIIMDGIDTYASRVGATYNKIFLRNSQIWGSCSTRRNLNFNWQLASLPEDLAEYIVIHELAHLSEPNHSKRFWDVVSSLCPDYKDREGRLKWYRIKKR